MAEQTLLYVVWKKGETGNQKFIIKDSDGSVRNLTGHNYTFKFWSIGASVNKGSGSLTITDAVNGEAEYAIQAADTNTEARYVGEIIENDTAQKTTNIDVLVLGSAPA